jgi:predicted acetyltransferase
MTLDVRVTSPDEYRAAVGSIAVALMFSPPNDEDWAQSLPSWEIMPSYSAWDGDRCVGHAGQFLVDTTVPGGTRLPTAAVSRVGVLPTHRRRGLATRLMHALVDDAIERGLALMSLRASEAVIYQRYGFGVAADFCEAAIDAGRAGPLAGAATDGSFRYLAADEILEAVPPVYDRAAHRRPGVITRPMEWWKRLLHDAIEGKKGSYVVVHLDASGRPDGYVHYESKWDDESFVESAGTGKVHDLFGADDSVELALWQFLFDLDLVTRWTAEQRPADDLVRLAARDSRAYRLTSISDEQWLRLVDVDRALAARTYRAATGSVTVAVNDPLIAANSATWRIGAAGAEPVDEPADLTASIADLSAAYLGGTSWWGLVASGAVHATSPEAVAIADTLFASRPLPFCGTFF